MDEVSCAQISSILSSGERNYSQQSKRAQFFVQIMTHLCSSKKCRSLQNRTDAGGRRSRTRPTRTLITTRVALGDNKRSISAELLQPRHVRESHLPRTRDQGAARRQFTGGVSRRTSGKWTQTIRIWWGKSELTGSTGRIKRFLSEVKQGVTPQTIWSYEEVGHTQEAKKEILKLFDEDVFLTPKPERLMQRVLQVATNSGDLVLDSFLGSGTTAAVAHKMGRRYIAIELGEHAVTHCAPRLQKVVDGEQGGISDNLGWPGGGGFRFYRLGPPVFDEEGHIRQDIRFPVLAAHVWFSETDRPWDGSGDSPLLGIQDGRAHALLYNGILGDKRPGGGNVLTRATLALIREDISKLAPDFEGPLTVYGEQSRLTPATLDRERITFKQTPYDVKARA